MEGFQLLAMFHFWAVAAGFKSFALGALPYLAHVAAEVVFGSLFSAAQAVDALGRYLVSVVHLAPFCGHLTA